MAEKKRRMSFNQKCLFALCVAMLLVGFVNALIGGLLLGNRAAASRELTQFVTEVGWTSETAATVEGAFQLATGLADVVVFGLGLWGALRPRRIMPFLVVLALSAVVFAWSCISLALEDGFGFSEARSAVVIATMLGFALAVRREYTIRNNRSKSV